MSTAPSASDYFGGMVDRYDSLIRRAVPRYDEMTDRLVEHLPAGATRVLELGCGTGNLTLRLLSRYPAGQVTTVDAAPEMTELTTDRAAREGAASRLITITARFEELSFVPGTFDLVASCMSLHHVRDKGPLYEAFSRWLTPRGALRFADQLLGATDEIQKIFWDRWLEFCRRPDHCSEEEITSLIDHAAAHDHYTPLTEHVRLLGGAGFVHIDCVWRNLMYSVVAADLP